MLLSFFACLTFMFAPVGDSVEMIRFVTFATCHVTTNTNNSVLDCIADEITGLLLILEDVTLK